jgi:hypothetical protein
MKAAGQWMALAVAAGIVLGVTSRIAMRLVALQAEVGPEFSLGGSIEVVLFGVLVGAPAALAFWACRNRFALPAWSAILAALLVFAGLVVWQPPAAQRALLGTPDAPIATVAVFAAAFVLYGIALELFWRLKQSE